MYLVQVTLHLIGYSYYRSEPFDEVQFVNTREKSIYPCPPIITFFDIFRKDYSKDIFQLYIFSYELNVKSMK